MQTKLHSESENYREPIYTAMVSLYSHFFCAISYHNNMLKQKTYLLPESKYLSTFLHPR